MVVRGFQQAAIMVSLNLIAWFFDLSNPRLFFKRHMGAESGRGNKLKAHHETKVFSETVDRMVVA
jgi:hypothetical protein